MIKRLRWVLPVAGLAVAWGLAVPALWRSQVPDGLRLVEPDPARYFGSSFLERSADYERFLRVDALLSVVALVAVLSLYAWRGARLARESAAGRVGTGMLLAMLGFGLVWLSQLPFGIAALWWERRHQVSRQGYIDWALGSWFSLGGEFLFICVAIGIVMGIAAVLKDWWWILGAPVFAALVLLFTFVQPLLLAGLTSPHDHRLDTQARQLERAQGLSRIPVKVEKVKEFTMAPNAEAVGLGPTRRVILWDTLVDGGFNRKEIRFVLAHELGHHSRNHLWKGAAWFALLAFPIALVIAAATRRRGGLYSPQAVPLALLVLVAIQLLVTPVQNAVVRHLEAEADWVALQTTHEPAAARGSLERLALTSLANPDPPGWSGSLLDNHPSIMQRIAMVNAWEKRRRTGRVAREGPTH